MAGILSSYKTVLHPLSDLFIRNITARETLYFEMLWTQHSVLFIIISEQELAYFNFLQILIYSKLFRFYLAMPIKQNPYLSIRFFLDEFGNMNIPNFPTSFSVLYSFPVLDQYVVRLEKRKKTILDFSKFSATSTNKQKIHSSIV
ncbi:type IV secretory system conjugative DNA transfer family protein [Aureispira sp. CCB-QB1]|uniref:type IV secretory system conjugative DNA transfer family protein n=1 Tax=Aureispira sp. CCB-QB1 TaxID=1313421 RepID=UPI0034CD997E